MTIAGHCPTCDLAWRDYEPGDHRAIAEEVVGMLR